MSLTSLIQHARVHASLDRIAPRWVRTLDVPTVVASNAGREHAQRIGTAFDYALRFEVGRLKGVPVGRRWVADSGLEVHARVLGQTPEHAELERWLRSAHRFVDAYARRERVSRQAKFQLARHVLGLAALDPLYRAGRIFPVSLEAPPGAVEEIVALLDAVPWQQLLKLGRPVLGPNFGIASMLVGGADADVLVGETLIEIKTVRHACIERHIVRQLLGYMLLSRRASRLGSDAPVIERFGIYFARHGHLVVLPPASADDDALLRAEDDFFAVAEDLRSAPRLESAGRAGAGRI